MYRMLFLFMLGLGVLLLFGMTVCLYQMLKHIVVGIFGEKKKKGITLLLVAVSVGFILYSVTIWNLGLIILLHFMGFILLIRLVDLVIKKIEKSRNQKFILWQKLQNWYIIPILMTAIVLGYGYWNMYHVEETNFVITTQKSIREEGYRVALLADVHFGVSVDARELEEIGKKIESENPDMVVLCGDIVDEHTTYEGMEQVFRILGNIKSKYGTYYVFGNHDRQPYRNNPVFTEADVIENLSKNGILLLQDEKVQINEEFVLVGRKDASVGNRDRLLDLYQDIDKNDFILTLDHQPLEYRVNKELGTDLLLSGHTHAGQFFPANLIMEMVPFGDAVYGGIKMDSFAAFVTSGLAGWKFPIKTSAPAEYVIIDIKKDR